MPGRMSPEAMKRPMTVTIRVMKYVGSDETMNGRFCLLLQSKRDCVSGSAGAQGAASHRAMATVAFLSPDWGENGKPIVRTDFCMVDFMVDVRLVDLVEVNA